MSWLFETGAIEKEIKKYVDAVANAENEIAQMQVGWASSTDSVYLWPGFYIQQRLSQLLATPTEIDLPYDDLQSPKRLRLPANRPAKLTLSGLTSWQFEQFELVVEVQKAECAIPISGNFARPPGATAGNYEMTYAFEMPTYVKRLEFEAGNPSRVDDGPYSGLYDSAATAAYQPTWDVIEERVETLSFASSKENPGLIAAILPNIVEGLTISGPDAQMLHRQATLLKEGDAMTSPDLAAQMNGAGDQITLELVSSHDAEIELSARFVRYHAANGGLLTTDEAKTLPDQLRINSWKPVEIEPALPADVALANLRAVFQTKLSSLGGKRLGLSRVAGLSSHNSSPNNSSPHNSLPRKLHLLPGLKLAQPMSLDMAPSRAGLTLQGIWLMLPDAPLHPAKIEVSLHYWQEEGRPSDDAIFQQTIALPTKRTEYIKEGPDMLAYWAAFEADVTLDTRDLERPLAVVLEQQDGEIWLMERDIAAPPLLPSHYHTPNMAANWQRRDFAFGDKNLCFDLAVAGEPQSQPILFIQSGEQHDEITADDDGMIRAELPAQPFTLSSFEEVELTDITLETRSEREASS